MRRKRDPIPGTPPKKLYRLFGVTMASNYSFAIKIPPAYGIPDVSFTCSQDPICRAGGMKKPVFTSPAKTDNGESIISIEKMDAGYFVHFVGSVDFFLTSDTIIAHPLNPARTYLVEMFLLEEIFSLWLELRGIRTIHASAAVVDNNAIAFLASSRSGKSGLAAAFAAQGYQLLTDDLVPVDARHGHFLARSGYPEMRMWPDLAEHFLGGYEDLELVYPEYAKRRILIGPAGFGRFCPEEKPLKVIYIPHRDGPDSDITIEPVSKKDGFFALLQHSLAAGAVEALGLQPERMKFFTSMVEQIPFRRLNYPEGFGHLSRVVDAVVGDLASI